MRHHVILLFVPLFFGSGCTDTHAGLAPGVRAVRVAAVEDGPSNERVTLPGVTRAAERARLGLPLGGRIVARPVRVGDRVQAGDLLARLDPAPFVNQERAARARVGELERRADQLSRDLARLERLDGSGSSTASERERVATERAALDEALDGARAALDESGRLARDAALRAPFAGRIAAVHVEPGETVGAGAALIELVGDGLEVEVALPESLWVRVDRATAARVELPALGVAVDAPIVDLGDSAPRGGLFPLVVAVPEGPRRVPGLTATVALSLPVAPSPVVPVRAIVDPLGGEPAVLTVDAGVARRVPVTIGGLHGDRVAVRGLEAGGQVIVAGHAQLLDGEPVQVLP